MALEEQMWKVLFVPRGFKTLKTLPTFSISVFGKP